MEDFFEDIEYQSGFKYQVTKTCSVKTAIVGYDVDTDYYSLSKEGLLTAKKGYSWDGASGCPDFRCIMRGSLFHDVLYQMMRLKQLPRHYRKDADNLLRNICIEDGMCEWFANYIVYFFVRKFGKKATHPNNKRKIYTAP